MPASFVSRRLRTTYVAALALASATSIGTYSAATRGLTPLAIGLASGGLLLLGLISVYFARALRELELLSLVASRSGVPVLISDAIGRTQWVNEPFEQLSGYSLAEMRGRRPGDLLRGPETDPATAQAFNEALAAGTPARGELLNYRKDGTRFWVELASTPVRDAAGQVSHFVCVQNDVSARVQAEAAMRETVALNQAILDGAGHLIIATAADGTITRVNPAAERALGYSAAELVGRARPYLFHAPEEVERHLRQLRTELADHNSSDFELFHHQAAAGKLAEHEWTFVRKDGSRFPVQMGIAALRDADGSICGYVGIASDISERQAANRMKHELVSIVSHELRTPLTSIRGALALLGGGVAGSMPAQALAMIEIASKNCERLIRLLNDMLDAERLEAGKLSIRLAPLDLVPIVEQAIEANRPFAAGLGVEIKLASALAAVTVRADADRLTQVLTNLLSNAAKFSPAGETVVVSLERCGDHVRIAVSDHGPGIPADFQPQIFQRFAQARSTNARVPGGSGLGLSITRAIVEQHEGRIGFRSDPGAGSTFFVELPLLAPPSARPGRVLVVEDNRETARLIAAILERAGYAIDFAGNVAEAHAALRNCRYSGITLDLHLPGSGAIDLIRELREAPQTCNTPIVVISAWAEQGRDALEGELAGAVVWLGKPLDRQRLLRALSAAPGPAARSPQAAAS